MSKGRVLVIEGDEWLARMLATALKVAGFEVLLADAATEGFHLACAQQPDCIVCDVELPDLNGLWVARRVRTETSRVAVSPFLFLTESEDAQAKLQGFHVGADVYIQKPFRIDEAVAQVAALVQMANRLRARRDSFLEAGESPGTVAMTGDLSQMSLATILTILEMERRSGELRVTNGDQKASIHLATGFATAGRLAQVEVSPLAALREALRWKTGRFAFRASENADAPQARKSIGALLIEAVRLDDEQAHPVPGPARATAPRPPPIPKISGIPATNRSSISALADKTPQLPKRRPPSTA